MASVSDSQKVQGGQKVQKVQKVEPKIITIDGLGSSDIPRFIGNKGMNMKRNVIFPSWSMYDEHIKDKGIEEDKPRLFVGISDSDDSVTATIKTESSIMMKFAEHNLKKYIEKVTKSKTKRMDVSSHTVLAICPHSKIPQIIGKGGSSIKKLRNDSADILDENSYDLATKSFIKINPHEYDSVTDLCMKVRQDETMSFMGWEPDEGDTDEYISINISSKLKGDDFESFIDEFKTNVKDKISSILEYHSRMMSDIDQALESDEE